MDRVGSAMFDGERESDEHEKPSEWGLNRFLELANFACVLYFIAIFGVIAIMRVRYPFELEWMEGGSVDHVRRILEGAPIYAKPQFAFVSSIYMPLYFYVSAAFAYLTGLSFTPLRLVSILSTILSMALIFSIVRLRTHNAFWGIFGAGLTAASFAACGGWFDIARVDAMFAMLLLTCIHLECRMKDSRFGPPLVAFAASLAFWVKQSGLFFVLALSLYFLIKSRKQFMVFLICVSTLTGGVFLILDRVHGGWLKYYTFTLPSQFKIVPEMILHFLLNDLIYQFPIMLAATIFYFAFAIASRKFLVSDSLLLLTGLGMFASGFSTRVHFGGYVNGIIPAVMALSLIAPIAAHGILERSSSRKRMTHAIVQAGFLMQFILLIYDPSIHVPAKEDTKNGEIFMNLLKSINGDVYAPNHTYLASLAGKNRYAHQQSVLDIMRADNHPAKEDLTEEIKTALRGKRFQAIILDSELKTWFWRQDKAYYLAGTIPYTGEFFYTFTGDRTRPYYVYLPIE